MAPFLRHPVEPTCARSQDPTVNLTRYCVLIKSRLLCRPSQIPAFIIAYEFSDRVQISLPTGPSADETIAMQRQAVVMRAYTG